MEPHLVRCLGNKKYLNKIVFGNFSSGQNTLELPPEIDKGETGIFQSDPTKTLAAFQKDLEESGTIDLGRKVDVTAEEAEVFSMLLLSLNRKKYPLKLLVLDNCDLTDEKLVRCSSIS